MANRELIIDNLNIEITKQISQNFFNSVKIENSLKNNSEFFSTLEIEQYQEKVDILKYLEFSKKNIELNIYYILDIKSFLLYLKNKRKKFIKKIYEECINSIYNYQSFCTFIMKSEFYFENNKYYFKDEEIKKYNELWFELEIENASILSENEGEKIKQKWDSNFENILKQIEEMLIYLDTIM